MPKFVYLCDGTYKEGYLPPPPPSAFVWDPMPLFTRLLSATVHATAFHICVTSASLRGAALLEQATQGAQAWICARPRGVLSQYVCPAHVPK